MRINTPANILESVSPQDTDPDEDGSGFPVNEEQEHLQLASNWGNKVLRNLRIGVPPQSWMGSSMKNLKNLKERQQVLDESFKNAEKRVGALGLGGGKARSIIEMVPTARYKVTSTGDGYDVIDNATDVVVKRHNDEDDAFSHLDVLRTSKASEESSATIRPDEAEPRSSIADDDGVSSVTRAEQNRMDEDTSRILDDDAANRILVNRVNAHPTIKNGLLGGIRMVGSAGDPKVPDEGNIRQIISEIAREIKPIIGNPEKVSLSEVESMRDLIGSNPKHLVTNLQKGLAIDLSNPGSLGAHLSAAKSLLVSEVRRLDELADAAGVDASLESKLEWKRQADLVANLHSMYKGSQTEIARALGAFRIASRSDADLLGRDFDMLARDLGGVDALDSAISEYKRLGPASAHKKLKYINGVSKMSRAFSALHEVWINSILSGYWTHVKNTAGGLSAILADDVVLAYTAARQSMSKNPDITFGDVQARLFGQIMSLQEALSESGKRFLSREEVYGTSKLEHAGLAGQRPINAFSAAGLDTGTAWGGLVDGLGSALTLGRLSTRLLVAEDTVIKVISYRGSLYEQAYREASNLGKKGDDLGTYVANFVHNPPERAAEKAKDLAKYNSLQTEMEGQFYHYQKAFSKNRFMRWVVPFMKTPTNALLWVGDHSPLAIFTNRWKKAMAEGGESAAIAHSRLQAGTIAGLAVWSKVADGTCTGSISSDPRVLAAFDRQGIKPYSCKIGDKYIPYNFAEPVSSIISVLADVHEVISHPDVDESTALETMGGVIGAIGYNFTQKSFMTGLQKWMGAISSRGNRGENLLRSYATSMLPASSMLNDIKRMDDDIKRFRYGFLDHLKSRLPGLSRDLPPQRDLWGRVTTLHRAYSPYVPNVVDREMARIQLGVGEHPNGYEVEYTPEERDWFHQRAGELSLQNLTDFMDQRISTDKVPYFKDTQHISIHGTGSMKKLATDNIKDAFRKIIRDSRTTARDELERHPVLGRDLQDAIWEVKNFEADLKRKVLQR